MFTFKGSEFIERPQGVMLRLGLRSRVTSRSYTVSLSLSREDDETSFDQQRFECNLGSMRRLLQKDGGARSKPERGGPDAVEV